MVLILDLWVFYEAYLVSTTDEFGDLLFHCQMSVLRISLSFFPLDTSFFSLPLKGTSKT